MGTDDDDRPTVAQPAVGPDGSPLGEDDVHLAPGSDVGGYLIDGELGSGGMGVVYAATHPLIGKRAAIKILRPELSDNPAAVERFVMEARAVNQIGHPNIVDIFAFGRLHDGRCYYVMDYLGGESLRRRLGRSALHVSEAASVLDEVASALIAAHDKGIIHRDLKPDNVFMVSVPGRWPEVRLLDWGLLKLSSTQSAVSSGKYRTLAGSVFGTPVYMSPEQARASDRVDFRTDVYSLGVMAYEILAGVVPFKKGSSIDTLLAHQDEPVPSLAALCPGLPEELVQLIEAMLAKDPDERPTLAAVRAVIRRLRGTKIPTMTAAGLVMELPITPGPGSRPPTEQDSLHVTAPRVRASDMESMSQVMPLPAPPLTPMPDQVSLAPYASLNIVAQTTLAGHTMPSGSGRPSFKTPPPGSSAPGLPPGVSMQHQQFPPLMAPGFSATPSVSPGIPPQQSVAKNSSPDTAVRASGESRRATLLLVGAVVLCAIGIALLLLAR